MVSKVFRNWPKSATAAVAGLQGLALLGYALGISIIGLTSGLEGPAAVSSPTGAVVEVAAFALFGAGMVAIAYGRWRGAAWSGPPFVLSQLLALAVGLPLATATDTVGRTIGLAVTASAAIGLVSMVAGALRESDSDVEQQRADGSGSERNPN